MKRFVSTLLIGLLLSGPVFANSTPHDLSVSDFSQDWSDDALITTNDNWSTVPSIDGLRGDSLGGTNADPQTLLQADDPGVIDVNANQTNPSTFNTGGIAEFDSITDPVVAFQGSGTADAPYLRITLNALGRQNINVRYNLRDIDGANVNSTQQVALHFRVGNSGLWTDVPTAYVADASTGPGLATLVTPINVTLPAAVNNQALVQVRVMTTNSSGSDEFIGVDDIVISSSPTATPVMASAVVNNNVSVNGGSDGQATASGSGGSGTYSYLWSNGATSAVNSSLTAGVYSVTVTETFPRGGADSDVAMVTITEPTPVVATAVVDNNVSVNGGSDGQATVSGSGGNSGYTFAWNDGQTTGTATGLAAGMYTVTVTDSTGGNDTDSVTITEPLPAVVASAVVDNNVTVNGGNDGQATASGSGGTGVYTYLWSNGSTNATAMNLTAGMYSVTVTDTVPPRGGGGNSDVAMVTITEPTAVVATAVVDNDVLINGGSSGQATASGSGGTPGYTYLWSDGQTTATAINLAANTYTVTVTDSVGGNDTDSVTINEPPALLATVITVIDESFPGAGDGSATVSATGGVPGYTYLWSNGGTTATITGLSAGTYDVTVTDANGATASPAAQVIVAVLGPVPQVPVNSIWMLMALISLMLIVFFRHQKYS